MRLLGPAYSIFSLSLAFLMFFTSIGFSMDVHYCQDEMRNVSLLGQATSCHDLSTSHSCGTDAKSCHKSSPSKPDTAENHGCKGENDCCHNRHIEVDQLEATSLIGSVASAEDLHTFKAVLFPAHGNDLLNEHEPNRVKFLNYKPPLIQRDLQILFQSFLN